MQCKFRSKSCKDNFVHSAKQRELLNFYSFLETIRVFVHLNSPIVSLLLTSDRKSARCCIHFVTVPLSIEKTMAAIIRKMQLFCLSLFQHIALWSGLPIRNSHRRFYHFANLSTLVSMSLYHHNVSKNRGHDLTFVANNNPSHDITTTSTDKPGHGNTCGDVY